MRVIVRLVPSVLMNTYTEKGSIESTMLRVNSLYSFIHTNEFLINARAVNFFTHNHWECLSHQWQDSLLNATDAKSFIFPSTVGTNGSLEEFLHKASQLRLPMEDERHWLLDAECKEGLTFGMSAKKSHEVDRAARLISELATKQNVKQILDIGSGKGYLSEHLAIEYGLTVIGIDSQASNTRGAALRNAKVQKAQRISKQSEEVSPILKTPGALSHEACLVSCDSILFDDIKPSCSPNCDATSIAEPCHQSIVVDHSQDIANIKSNSMPFSSLNVISDKKMHQPSSHSDLKHSYIPLTLKIDPSNISDLLLYIQTHSNSYFQSSEPCVLIGLHTCGDLALTALKIFCDISSVRAVCVVGCCYNHCTENGNEPGFPASMYLKSLLTHLGKTARLLAGQNLYKFLMATADDAMESLFFRSLLQLILRDKFGAFQQSSNDDYCVSKLKYLKGDFCSYVEQALTRLKLDPSKVSIEERNALFAQYSPQKVYLQRFIQLQGALSPCIESLIVLDRLLFVQEKLGGDSAYILQLFDPMVSPRCYAIVGSK